MGWRLYKSGLDPELDQIVRRRFGPRFERPCSKATTIECALPKCQYANMCMTEQTKEDVVQ
jgi:hypothetical protein